MKIFPPSANAHGILKPKDGFAQVAADNVIDRRFWIPSPADFADEAVALGPPMVKREGYTGIPYPWGARCSLAPAQGETKSPLPVGRSKRRMILPLNGRRG